MDTWTAARLSDCAFNFFIGGRGIGKTYSALKGHKEDFDKGNVNKLMYMRLSQVELDLCATDSDNPYKKLNAREHWGVKFESVPKSKAYDIIDENSEQTIGTARALATFGNVRGSDFFDVSHIYVDEFNPTEKVRKSPELKNAGYLFAQAYETINRNRELEGEPPVKVIFTANAFTLDSNILYYYGIIPLIQQMQKSGQKKATLRDRSIYVELCEAADIAEAKQETVLYKALNGNKKLINTNINNKFNDYNLSLVKKIQFVEYLPVVQYEDICIYQHKSTGEYYAARKFEQCGNHYTEKERGLFVRIWKSTLTAAIWERAIFADNVNTLYELQQILNNPL